jgi:hypothetical protein
MKNAIAIEGEHFFTNDFELIDYVMRMVRQSSIFPSVYNPLLEREECKMFL